MHYLKFYLNQINLHLASYLTSGFINEGVETKESNSRSEVFAKDYG
jgi:hypothetical protein